MGDEGKQEGLEEKDEEEDKGEDEAPWTTGESELEDGGWNDTASVYRRRESSRQRGGDGCRLDSLQTAGTSHVRSHTRRFKASRDSFQVSINIL